MKPSWILGFIYWANMVLLKPPGEWWCKQLAATRWLLDWTRAEGKAFFRNDVNSTEIQRYIQYILWLGSIFILWHIRYAFAVVISNYSSLA